MGETTKEHEYTMKYTRESRLSLSLKVEQCSCFESTFSTRLLVSYNPNARHIIIINIALVDSPSHIISGKDGRLESLSPSMQSGTMSSDTTTNNGHVKVKARIVGGCHGQASHRERSRAMRRDKGGSRGGKQETGANESHHGSGNVTNRI